MGFGKGYIINLQLFFSVVGIFGEYLCVQFRSKQRVKIVYMTLSPMFHGPTAQEIMLYHQNDTESWQEKLPQNWWFVQGWPLPGIPRVNFTSYKQCYRPRNTHFIRPFI